MIIGVPKEIKCDEFRVGLLPVGAEELTRAGHKVLVESGAGLGSGLSDDDYVQHGAELVVDAAEVFARAHMIIKVKEPQPCEYPMLRPDQIVFTYFHFAADRQLTKAVLDSGCTAVAYETLKDERGRLPLLTPMSEVAGRMSIQEGAKYLERPQMGRGILLGGVPGVEPAHVTILGGGVVGCNAAKIAAGFRARVTILDVDMDRLRYLDDIMPANVEVLFSDREIIRHKLPSTDLLIGAVLIPGARAPYLVKRDDLRLMKPGSVIVDVAIDQGGCVETSHPYDAQRSDLSGRRDTALLRRQYPRRGGPYEHVCVVQCHVAMGSSNRRTRCARRREAVASYRPRHQHVSKHANESRSGCSFQHAVFGGVRRLAIVVKQIPVFPKNPYKGKGCGQRA